MDDFDLRTFGRKMLLFVAILSVLVMGEMVLVSAEEPAGPVQQQTANTEPRKKTRRTHAPPETTKLGHRGHPLPTRN
jgi:hypothetical protein